MAKTLQQLFEQSSDSYPLNLPIGVLAPAAISGEEHEDGQVLQIVNGIAAWGGLTIDAVLGDGALLGVISGGTGLGSYTVGDLIVATQPTELSVINDVVTGRPLFSTGVGSIPAYRRITAADVDAGTFPGALYSFTTGKVAIGVAIAGTYALKVNGDIAIRSSGSGEGLRVQHSAGNTMFDAVEGITSNSIQVDMNGAHNSAAIDRAIIILRAARNTLLSPQAVISGDRLGRIRAEAYYDTVSSVTAADVAFFADGAPTGVQVPGRIDFTVNTGSGVITSWSMKSTGHLITGIDNSYDIGASAATRPRSVYLGTSLVIHNDPLTFVDTGHEIRIGTTNAGYFSVKSADSAAFVAGFATSATLSLRRYNGNWAAKSAVLSGELLASLGFQGWDGLITQTSTAIRANASENYGANFGSTLSFLTTLTGGSTLAVAWVVSGSRHFLAGIDNTYDIGASAATRPRSGYFGTSILVGSEPFSTTGTIRTDGSIDISGTYVSEVNAGGTGFRTRGSGASAQMQLVFERSLGTLASPTIQTAAASVHGDILFRGFNSGITYNTVSRIRSVTEATWVVNTDNNAALIFATTAIGSVTLTDRWRINNAGHFLVEADNTYDMGVSATGRIRHIYAVLATVHETGGAELTMFGAVADGDFLKRSGTNIIGGTPGVAASDNYPAALGYAGI